MITYQEEKFYKIAEEVKPILIEHWEELANHKDIRPLDPDLELYTELNNLDAVRIFTVRDGSGLIGYASFTVSPNMHYQTWLYAVCDVYYLSPKFRKTGIGLEMFQEIEKWLKSMGVKSIIVQDKINHSHESFFVKLGFTPIEQNYEKLI